MKGLDEKDTYKGPTQCEHASVHSYPACGLITDSAALLVFDAASAVLKLQEEARAEEQ